LEPREPLGGLGGGDAGERLGRLVERHERDDGEARDASHRVDRVLDLVQVVERLDEEEVDAAPVEDARLLGEELSPDARGGALSERPDRTGDEDRLSGDLACVSRELDRRRVDPLDVVLEVVLAELPAVRTERVRLDELRPGVDEADVERDHRLRRAHVRLLGAAQARDGSRHERAHPAVGDDRRPGLETLEERAHRGIPARTPGGSHAARSSRRAPAAVSDAPSAVNRARQHRPGDRSTASG